MESCVCKASSKGLESWSHINIHKLASVIWLLLAIFSRLLYAFWQMAVAVNDSITDFSSLDAVRVRHWRARIWIQQPEWCYKGLMKTGAAERRYLGREVRPAEDRTFLHAEDGSVLYPVRKADFRDAFFFSTLCLAQAYLIGSTKMYPKTFQIKSWSRWYHPQQVPFYQNQDVCFLVAVD